MTERNWFDEAFGSLADGAADAMDSIRHELLGGWFGRTFEPHPSAKSDPVENHDRGEPDRGNIHDVGLDR